MISLADPDLSPTYRSRLLEAVLVLGEQVLPSSAVGHDRPVLVVGGLRSGERRLSPELVAACDRWPEVPVLVACDEELVQPVVRLQGGRLTLVSQSLGAAPLGQALATCLGWSQAGSTAIPAGDPMAADHDHWWSGVVVCGLPEAPQATLQHERCLNAWLRAGPGGGSASGVTGEIASEALDAWSRRLVGASATTRLAGLADAPVPGGCAAGVHLDPDGLALLHAVGPHWQLIIASSQRLPAWCVLTDSQALRTQRGDVLIAAWVADGTPVPVLGGSGRAIAQELGRRWAGLAASAVIVEVR